MHSMLMLMHLLILSHIHMHSHWLVLCLLHQAASLQF
jgi:hypothetical protein